MDCKKKETDVIASDSSVEKRDEATEPTSNSYVRPSLTSRYLVADAALPVPVTQVVN